MTFIKSGGLVLCRDSLFKKYKLNDELNLNELSTELSFSFCNIEHTPLSVGESTQKKMTKLIY
jgi:hypothetical protein